MALNHPKMRRILDKYWRVPGRSLTSQWDGDNGTLQAYFNAQDVTNATAAEVIAKESDYDTFLAAIRALQKTYADRRQAYGEWGDQLDEIFHDIDAWKTRIAAIKAAHPIT
jgi:hypothetical protein